MTSSYHRPKQGKIDKSKVVWSFPKHYVSLNTSDNLLSMAVIDAIL